MSRVLYNILGILPLFIVIVIGFYIAQWLKGNYKPLKNMLSVLCAIFVLIIAGSCIYFFYQTGSDIITALVMILTIMPISVIVYDIKRR